MRALILIHRWLGVASCLLFAMWFATGMVMHFVPFPALTEAERIAGLAPVDPTVVRHAPAAAVLASNVQDATQVRLLERADGQVYLVRGTTGIAAVFAADLAPAAVRSESVALAIAAGHARRRTLDAARATFAELATHDQWTVPNGLDAHRPLYRIALNDAAGTELYVSSATGEVVRDTTGRERWWNYAGSVTHWIYPTVLRRDWRAWDMTVWTLALVALLAAIAGTALGTLRIEAGQGRLVSPYRGWHAWHHWLGLGCMTFVLTWIFSGWLSMDHGRLFSTGRPDAAHQVARVSAAAWEGLSMREIQSLPAHSREIEWFVFDGRLYRRERLGLAAQRLTSADAVSVGERGFLRASEITAAVSRVMPVCSPAVVVRPDDDYAIAPAMPSAPVYRAVCGDTWLHFDGADGTLLEKLDASRRAYRWAYAALHTLDFPVLAARPALRTALVVTLCVFGLAFSLTGVVIGWRRLRRGFAAPVS